MTQDVVGSLASLIDFLSKFDETKAHIIASQREFLLAIRSALDVFIQVLSTKKTEPDPMVQVLVIFRSMMDYLIAKFPVSDDALSRQAKLDALKSILQMLEKEEIELKNSLQPDEEVQLRLDVIRSIKKMVEKEIEKVSQPSKKRVRKVEVE